MGFLKECFGCEVYGLDSDDSPSPRLIPLDGFYRMDISQGSPSRSFDVVIEHVQDHAQALVHMRAVCDKYLLVTVPGGPIRATDRFMGHVRHYDLASLNHLVADSGFKVIRSFAWGFPFHSAYKVMQDVVPGMTISQFGKAGYGAAQKFVCDLLYGFFYLNLRRRGFQLFLLAEKN